MSEQKKFFSKIYIVIILTILILLGLIYLLIHHVPVKNNTAVASEDTEPLNSPVSTPSAASEPPVPISLPTSEPEEADVTDNASLLRIVNKNHLLDPSYIPSDLTAFEGSQNGQQYLRSDAAKALNDMFTAAENDGISLYLISGYRDYTEQTSLYYTYEERYGREYADSIDDRPGESEHQLGLAADIGTRDHNCELDGCFAYTSAFAWLNEHAPEYGFIERYPDGKEDITGVSYSPWNFRYVGKEAAEKISASGLTMEEYYNLS